MKMKHIRLLQYEAAMAGKEYRHSTTIKANFSVVYGEKK
jgi:hypothetical protein